MTKTNPQRKAIWPTDEEEAAIQNGIAQEADNPEWTAEEIEKARQKQRNGTDKRSV